MTMSARMFCSMMDRITGPVEVPEDEVDELAERRLAAAVLGGEVANA